MNEVEIIGQVIKIEKNKFNKKQFDEDFVWVKNIFGFFVIGVDKLLARSIYIGQDIFAKCELKVKNINSEMGNEKLLYISAKEVYEKKCKICASKVKIMANINKITSILGTSEVIFADFEGVELCLETVHKTENISRGKDYKFNGYIIPHVLDKHGLLEYIIRVNQIEKVDELERG